VFPFFGSRNLRLALAASCCLVACRSEATDRRERWEPRERLVLWAWDRDEDLRFLASPSTGDSIAVAALVATFTLRGDEVVVRPRTAIHRYPAGVARIDVVRIEVDRASKPTLSRAQAKASAEALASLASSASSPDPPASSNRELQIDFDATKSERSFYRALLTELRALRGPHARNSITALASWCFGDPWIADLPIDDAVPMLFRLGVDKDVIRGKLARGEAFSVPLCRQSLGRATDEPLDAPSLAQRNFIFHPRSWTRGAYLDARRAISTNPPRSSP
jgi:hypothetical protein